MTKRLCGLVLDIFQAVAQLHTLTATTFGISTESTYDWTDDQWTAPINPLASQL
jgi:hypothetical protein